MKLLIFIFVNPNQLISLLSINRIRNHGLLTGKGRYEGGAPDEERGGGAGGNHAPGHHRVRGSNSVEDEGIRHNSGKP